MKLPFAIIIGIIFLGTGIFLFMRAIFAPVDVGDRPTGDVIAGKLPVSAAPTEEASVSGKVYSLFDNVVVSVPGEDLPVSLSGGEGIIVHGPGATERTEVSVVDEVYSNEYRMLSAVLALHTGGTGRFYWLVLYEAQSTGTLIKRDAIWLGDRIKINYLRAKNNEMEVNLYERGAEEPYSQEPTNEVTLHFTTTNNKNLNLTTCISDTLSSFTLIRTNTDFQDIPCSP